VVALLVLKYAAKSLLFFDTLHQDLDAVTEATVPIEMAGPATLAARACNPAMKAMQATRASFGHAAKAGGRADDGSASQ
jgi:hypothetical protein